MISLSDLKAKRAAMTQGEWVPGEDAICTSEDDGSIYVGSLESTRDATGIVATHNAADTLIEIVEAVVAIHGQTLTDQEHTERLDRLSSALRKVQP